jgi:hypothetical protein
MDNSIVTTTTTQSSTWKIPVNLAWRRATVPAPNRPPIVIQPTILASSMTDNSLKQKDPENKFQSDDNKASDDFDAFILRNFIPFSGEQQIIPWLDETEDKFIELNIGRTLRFDAVPLLIEGKAKRIYLKHRKEMRSFDDFYEFLLSNFDHSNTDTDNSKSDQSTAVHQLNIPESVQPRSAIESTSTAMNITEVTNLPRQPPAFCSTAPVDTGATSILGETSATATANATNNLSLSMLDQTLNDLSRAIVLNVIENTKAFKGGKEDSRKWTEDIKHLLNVAHIPDSTRLHLISYSMRGDVFERFKTIDQAQSSFLTDEAREMFSSISYNRCNPLGHEASACSTL